MAQTTTTSLGALIKTEQIAESIENASHAPNPFAGLVWIKDCSQGRSPKAKFTRWNAIETTTSEGSPKAEGAAPSEAIELTADAAEAEAEVVDVTIELTWEAEQDAGVKLDDALQLAIPALRERCAKDCFLNLQSASNTSSYTGLPVNITRLGELTASFDLQVPNAAAGPTALVLDSRHFHQFTSSLRASTASLHIDPQLKELFGPAGPYMGTYEGTPVFKTPLLPASGPSNKISAIMKIGQPVASEDEVNRYAAIGLATWWGDDTNKGMFRGYRLLVKEEGSGVYQLFISMRYGTTLTNPRNSRALLAAAA